MAGSLYLLTCNALLNAYHVLYFYLHGYVALHASPDLVDDMVLHGTKGIVIQDVTATVTTYSNCDIASYILDMALPSSLLLGLWTGPAATGQLRGVTLQ